MKIRTLNIAAAVLGTAVLLICSGGCALTPWGVIQKNTENSRRLRVGMTKAEVLEIMGEPIRDEKFCEPDMWFYYREMVWGDGLLTEDECLPLIFEDGKLIGWGNNFRLDHRLKRRKENPGNASEPESGTKTETKPETKPAAEAKTETKPETKPATETKTETKPDPKPAAGTKTGTKPEPKPAVGTKTETKPEPKPAAGTKTETKPEPKPAAGTKTGTKTETKPEPKP